MTLNKIRYDLKQIRYIHSMTVTKTPGKRVIVSKTMESLLKKYAEAMEKAPVRLYTLFNGLYVECKTQKELALEWGCSEGYIKLLSKQLCQYLQSVMTG